MAVYMPKQWNLYKAITKHYGLSREVVFYSRETKLDFVKRVPDKWNLCILVRFSWSHYTGFTVPKHKFHTILRDVIFESWNSIQTKVWTSNMFVQQKFGVQTSNGLCCQAPTNSMVDQATANKIDGCLIHKRATVTKPQDSQLFQPWPPGQPTAPLKPGGHQVLQHHWTCR